MTEREAQALRDEFAGLSKEIRAAYRQGYADGVNDEREAVVAWLREWQGTMDDRITHEDVEYAFSAVERGEHRREEKKP